MANVCLLVLVLTAGCAADRDVPNSSRGSVDWFTDAAAQTGLDFVHFNGMSGRFYQTEIMAPGVALFDYDNDGDLDVYLVQGRMLGTGTPLIPPPSGVPLEDRLFRNDLQVAPDGTRTLRFTDVTAASGIHTRGYGMGIAAGDIDNDGWIDLYVTGFGRNQMFRNNGTAPSPTFRNQAARTTPHRGACRQRSWISIGTGWLDLFVGNYLNYSLQTHISCFGPSGAPDYCRPERVSSAAEPSLPQPGQRAIRGCHDSPLASGSHSDRRSASPRPTSTVTAGSTFSLPTTNRRISSGSISTTAHSSTRALLAGVALGANGERKANMGVDAGDFDNDGDEDLFVTELIDQGSSLYVNDGAGVFEEQSARLGVQASRVCRTPGLARPGSISTTTDGSTCWPSTATSTRTSRISTGRTIRFRWASAISCYATSVDGSTM